MAPYLRDKVPSFCQGRVRSRMCSCATRSEQSLTTRGIRTIPSLTLAPGSWTLSEVFGRRILTNSIEGCSL